MSKTRIDQNTVERCLLTEIVPYETPIVFSNWGSYNFTRTLRKRNPPQFLNHLFNSRDGSIPYKFKIRKDDSTYRMLYLVHPKHSTDIVDFYSNFSLFILNACKKSPFTLRAPHRVAKFYTIGAGVVTNGRHVEDITEETAYASSFFSYFRFSHLYKFFESDEFTDLEKKFTYMQHLDISKFFSSLYTHSVSWSIRGKKLTKKQITTHKSTFDTTFDKLLGKLNYNETNGIPVGPELSRIFSEIILQRIDLNVIKAIGERLELNEDYWYFRYIDDYFLFFNNEESRCEFINCLTSELEKYKLYLNPQKNEIVTRPFISPISIKKISLSDYVNDLFSRIESIQAKQSQKEINKLRSITKDSRVPHYLISHFLLSSLSRRIRGAFITNFDSVYVLLEISFHCLRMDVRVANTYTISVIVLDILQKIRHLDHAAQQKIIDKITFELKGAIENSISSKSTIECLNLIILFKELFQYGRISIDLMDRIITFLIRQHDDEYSTSKRLTYFDIVTLLYYIGNEAMYVDIKNRILKDALEIMAKHNPKEHAESFYLFLDIISCPYIDCLIKNSFIELAARHEARTLNIADTNHFRNFVSREVWFFNWNTKNNLRLHLKKKELLLSY